MSTDENKSSSIISIGDITLCDAPTSTNPLNTAITIVYSFSHQSLFTYVFMVIKKIIVSNYEDIVGFSIPSHNLWSCK